MSEKNREIERVEEESVTAPSRPRSTTVPRIDIIELDDRVILYVDMPGVDESTVDLLFDKKILFIRGEIKDEPLEGYQPVYTEYVSSSYQRSVALSDEIDQDSIAATFSNGVLTVTYPKKETAKSRKIMVNAV